MVLTYTYQMRAREVPWVWDLALGLCDFQGLVPLRRMK
jgi:hypothetical protein